MLPRKRFINSFIACPLCCLLFLTCKRGCQGKLARLCRGNLAKRFLDGSAVMAITGGSLTANKKLHGLLHEASPLCNTCSASHMFPSPCVLDISSRLCSIPTFFPHSTHSPKCPHSSSDFFRQFFFSVHPFPPHAVLLVASFGHQAAQQARLQAQLGRQGARFRGATDGEGVGKERGRIIQDQ